MLCNDRIDVSEGIDVNKIRIRKSKECGICYCWYFLHKGCKFHLDVCNGCYDLLMISIDLCDFTILNIKNADYRCIISGINKNGTINLMRNTDSIKKGEHYKT